MQRREDLASIEGLHNPWASFQAEQGRARALGDFKNFAGVLFPVLLVSRAINLGLMSPAHIYPNVFMILVSVFSACWGRYSPESYNLYRTPIIIAFRIAFFALPPFHLLVKSILFPVDIERSKGLLFLHYLVASSSLPAFGLALSRRLSVGIHTFAQLIILALIMKQNNSVCGALLQFPKAQELLDTLDGTFRIIAMLLFVPGLPVSQHNQRSIEQQCMYITSMLQITLAFAMSTAILAFMEMKELSGYADGRTRVVPTYGHRVLVWLYDSVFTSKPIATVVMILMGYCWLWILLQLIY